MSTTHNNGWDKPEVIAARLTELSTNVKALSRQIEDMGAWTRSHEQSEFGYHGRLEEHMALTREYIAGSRAAERAIETRLGYVEAADARIKDSIAALEKEYGDCAHALDASIQSKLATIQQRISWMMGGLGVVLLVVLPLASWALYAIHDLEIKVESNKVQFERELRLHSVPKPN